MNKWVSVLPINVLNFNYLDFFFSSGNQKQCFYIKKRNPENKIFFPATESFVITLKLKFLVYIPPISGR